MCIVALLWIMHTPIPDHYMDAHLIHTRPIRLRVCMCVDKCTPAAPGAVWQRLT